VNAGAAREFEGHAGWPGLPEPGLYTAGYAVQLLVREFLVQRTELLFLFHDLVLIWFSTE